jgi:shikimate 5-dehydrogenase
VTVFARDNTKASGLAQRFEADCRVLDEARFGEFDVVVNATPLGTSGRFEKETPATAPQLRGARLAYDLVYNPTETRFLQEAREAGCDTLGGLAMLVTQGAEQFRLWTGKQPPEAVMYQAAERELQK